MTGPGRSGYSARASSATISHAGPCELAFKRLSAAAEIRLCTEAATVVPKMLTPMMTYIIQPSVATPQQDALADDRNQPDHGQRATVFQRTPAKHGPPIAWSCIRRADSGQWR